MSTPRKPHSRAKSEFPATLLALLSLAVVALAACGGGEAASSTPAAAASPSPAVSTSPPPDIPSPAVWVSPRPAVSYSLANLPSIRTKTGLTPQRTARVRKGGTIGWEFTPTVDIEVTALGCFDPGRDGLARAHRVGIFDAETKRLLARVTVLPKSRLEGFFRWESLKTPLVLREGLESGRSYVVGTEDKGTLETLYTWHNWPNVEVMEETGAPPGEQWSEEIGPVFPGLYVSRPSQAAFTAPTRREDLWNGPPWFSPNFKFKPLSVSPSPAASTSPQAASQEPTSEQLPPQKAIILDDGVYRWDEPGTASLAQTQTVALRYAEHVARTKELPGVGLYAANATLDFWGLGWQLQGARNIQRAYRQRAADPDAGPGWQGRYRLLVSPGAAICEGMFMGSSESDDLAPYLVLLAVNGDRIAHEEVFIGDTGQSVAVGGSSPGPGDTAEVAARIAAALGAALATRDRAALQTLLASDVLFRDTTTQHDVRGRDAVLSWLSTVAPANVVKVRNRTPLAGPGWAVVRWTGRRFYRSWLFPNGVDESRNGATVIEVHDGKVVRMTLYLEPGDGGGSILRPE